MQTPTEPRDWKLVAKQFEEKWNFPHCIGAVDGRRVMIRRPQGSGSYYYNYKDTNSVVLMAVVDANYRFIYVNVGTNGRVSDGGAWDRCSLNERLKNNTAGLPANESLPGTNRIVPYVFVGDDAFPLKSYLLKPFPLRSQNEDERVYSYRLSRALRTVENAFGILANRFRVLLAPIHLEPAKVNKVVLACTVLHNFLISENQAAYTPTGSFDNENTLNGEITNGEWRSDAVMPGIQRPPRGIAEDAKKIRHQYCEYFNGVGSVPWQRSSVGLT